MRFKIKYLMLFLLLSCNGDKKIEYKELRNLLNSNDKNKIIEAYAFIGDQKKVEFINDVFINPYDTRISHDIKFYGISVYQSKMIALKKISGLLPPNKLTRDPDSTVVKFYYKWALEKHYIKMDVRAPQDSNY